MNATCSRLAGDFALLALLPLAAILGCSPADRLAADLRNSRITAIRIEDPDASRTLKTEDLYGPEPSLASQLADWAARLQPMTEPFRRYQNRSIHLLINDRIAWTITPNADAAPTCLLYDPQNDTTHRLQFDPPSTMQSPRLVELFALQSSEAPTP